MPSFKPPTPVALAVLGGSGGTSISNNTSSVIVNSTPETGDTVQIFTNNAAALTVNNDQRITFNGSEASNSRITVMDPYGDCITLVNSILQTTASLKTDSNGLTIGTSNSLIQFGANNIHIGSNSLYIGDILISSTANQLNYTDVTVGVAVALKALVVDENRDIININSLEAEQLTGTLLTANQPNINSLDWVNISALSLNGISIQATADELNYLYGTVPGQATVMKAFVFDSTLNINGINGLFASTLTGTVLTAMQPNITSLGTLTDLFINGHIGIGTTTPTRQLEIVSGSPTIRLSNGTVGAEITIDTSNNLHIIPDNNVIIKGDVELEGGSLTGISLLRSTSIVGTLQTAIQSNITQVGTLVDLQTDGDIIIGTLNNPSSAHRVIIKEQYGSAIELQRSDILNCVFDLNNFGDLTINPTRNVILPASLQITGAITGATNIVANTLTGTLLTADQSNITKIGILTTLDVIESISTDFIDASTINGTLLTANQSNITQLGSLINLNVINGITATSISATTLGGVITTAAQPQINQVGTLILLNVTGSITAGSLSADSLSGTLLTSDQHNITKIGILSSLTVSNLILANAIEVSEITGTILTEFQPNITEIGTLDSLNVIGTITASLINASTLNGTLLTAAQPNITQIGTLTSLVATNSVSTAALISTTLTGTLLTAYQPNITQIGILTKLLTTSPIGIGIAVPTSAIDIDTSALSTEAAIKITDGSNSAIFAVDDNGILLNTSGPDITIGSGKTIQMSGGTIAGLNTLTVNEFTGQIMTAAQPNITTVGTLNYLDTSYIGLGTTHLTNYRLNILATDGLFATFTNGSKLMTITMLSGDYALNASNQRIALYTDVDLVLNGGTIIGLDLLSVNQLSGTIMTPSQPNITALGTLSSLIVDGTTSVGAITATQITASSMSLSNGPLTVNGSASVVQGLTIGTTFTIGATTLHESDFITMLEGASGGGLVGGTAGVVVANLALVPDTDKNLASFNNLTATNLYGTARTIYQPYITTVGNLTDLNVVGYLGVGTTSPLKKVEISSVTGDCLRLSYTGNGAYADLTVDNIGNLTIASVGRTKFNAIAIGTPANATAIPVEVGYAAFTMTNPYSYRTNVGSMGVINPVSNPISYNYSIRADGRILCTGSIDVMSDRRLKKNIESLTDDFCSSFIECTNPVSYYRVSGDQNKSFGYIAQELMRAGFSDLVNLVPDSSVKEEIDDDGFISPEGVAYNISYEHIIPILAKNQQRLMRENAELRAKLDQILLMLAKDM